MSSPAPFVTYNTSKGKQKREVAVLFTTPEPFGASESPPLFLVLGCPRSVRAYLKYPRSYKATLHLGERGPEIDLAPYTLVEGDPLRDLASFPLGDLSIAPMVLPPYRDFIVLPPDVGVEWGVKVASERLRRPLFHSLPPEEGGEFTQIVLEGQHETLEALLAPLHPFSDGPRGLRVLLW